MIRCTTCGQESEPIFRFCLKCGAELPRPEGEEVWQPPVRKAKPKPAAEKKKEPETVPCPTCGTAVPSDRRFCIACGHAVGEEGAAAEREERGHLVVIQPDGTDGAAYAIYEGATAIGSEHGDHVFPDDDLMSPHHADLVFEAGELRVYDRDSRYGTFVRIDEVVPLRDRSQLRIGQQLLELRLEGAEGAATWGRVKRLTPSSAGPEEFPLEGDNVFIGRERGHVVFPDDGYVSGSHAVLFRQHGKAMLKDLDSSNGTYVRIDEPVQLSSRRLVLVGAHLFRVDI